MKETIPIFSKIGRIFLAKFADKLENKNCVKDQILYKKGEPTNFVYIVKSGEFVVSKKHKITNTQQDNFSLIHKDPKRANMSNNQFFNKNKIK